MIKVEKKDKFLFKKPFIPYFIQFKKNYIKTKVSFGLSGKVKMINLIFILKLNVYIYCTNIVSPKN